MKHVSLIFQIHHPLKLKKYRFSDICTDPYYYDDAENERLIREAAEHYYLPTNEKLIALLNKYAGGFRIAFSISGTALDLFCQYAPEVIESFQRMADTGGVEFLGETWSHSLASFKNKNEFVQQVEAHSAKIEDLFGQQPTVFKNTELIYSDTIGEMVAEMGFKAIITEGARQILKWRSPNHVYRNPINPELNVLFRNIRLSEDIAFRMMNPDWTGWVSVSHNYLTELNRIPNDEPVVNLFMDYETICQGQNKKNAGVFNFLQSFPSAVFEMTDYSFMTPSEIIDFNRPVSEIVVKELISRSDNEGGDLSAWLGNELQQEALDKLYGLQEKAAKCNDMVLLRDWQNLQTTDHFYYMCSKFFSNREVSSIINPFENPYEAFMTYMNVLNDFTFRLNRSLLNLKTDYIQKTLQHKLVS